eukprot:2445443-Pyramimonas_sp.AAC.2
MDVMGSTVDVKGSTVDVKGLMDGSHLRRFLLGVRDGLGGEPISRRMGKEISGVREGAAMADFVRERAGARGVRHVCKRADAGWLAVSMLRDSVVTVVVSCGHCDGPFWRARTIQSGRLSKIRCFVLVKQLACHGTVTRHK